MLENYFCTPQADVQRALPPGAVLIQGDVARPADVERAFAAVDADQALTVFHLAAQPSASIAARDPETTERTNLTGARLVLEAARQRRARAVLAGSFRVYGDNLDGQSVTEDAPYGSVGDLSHLSKIYIEHLARMVRVPCVSVRLGVTYGVSPIMKTDAPFMTVPNLFCQRAAAGEPLMVLENRAVAFIHVDDAARALLAAADLPLDDDTGAFRAVNAAPEVSTIGALARLVQGIGRERGLEVVVNDHAVAADGGGFAVRSRLEEVGAFRATHALARDLAPVLDYWMRRALAGP